MGTLTLKQDKAKDKDNKQASPEIKDEKFILSDVSKGELQKRRIPVYSFVL